MVLHKTLDYGSSGYQVPPILHVPKSAKGKRSVRKKPVDSRMCAFDLLAAVAGKLLLEGEHSSLPNKAIGTLNVCSGKEIVKDELLNDEKLVKNEACDVGYCAENTLGSNLATQVKVTSEECTQAVISVASGPVHVILKSDVSNKDAYTKQQSPCIDKLDEGKVKGGTVVDRNTSNLSGLEDEMDVVDRRHAMAGSDNGVKVSHCNDHILNNSFSPKCQDEKFLVDRDDDENSFGCINPSTTTNKALKHQGLGHRRIRKQLATKFWKVATTIKKDRELSNTEMKQSFRNRKICYTRQRTQRSSFKRGKLFQRFSLSTSNGGINCEDNRVSSSSIKGHLTSYESEDLHVKVAIKSFKVPELFIEIPETSTVGSLKTTVMEAVTAILGGGLRVGVLFQGKKVRDDNKTLIQAGISHGDILHDLGFTLEPDSSQSTLLLARPEEPHLLLPSDDAEPLTRFSVTAPASDGGKLDFSPELVSNYNSVHFPADSFILDKTVEASRPLMAIPSMSMEPAPTVPICKPRQSDVAQRRIRRPFSVSEVEALVQAVEKLGTGRWRDVKIRAFANAKHRTYVDLKDKWKTLVHTSRISPQQRRGEPVPQELLDRVLSAHAHWSQQQAKLQSKSPPTGACLLN